MLSDFRSVPRYFLPNGLPACLDHIEVNVVDLSVKGARLQLTQSLAVGAKMPFALTANGSMIKVEATVLWCQMAALALDDEESDQYLAGVVFDHSLPQLSDVLNLLIASDLAMAIEDARTTERYCITIPLAGTFGDRADVRLLDLSIRGARIGSRELVRVGTRLSLRFRLEPGPAVDVVSTAVWCRKSERRPGYEVGLCIADEEPLLRAVLAQMCMRKQARVNLNSLRRKFNPLRSTQMSGLVALAS